MAVYVHGQLVVIERVGGNNKRESAACVRDNGTAGGSGKAVDQLF